jgi:myo-inositol-1(or 4)-monophosphatase
MGGFDRPCPRRATCLREPVPSCAGASLNGAPLPPPEPSPPLAAGPKLVLDRFLAAVDGFSGHPKVPSLATRIAMAADGGLAVALASDGAREWDVAAADLIVAESGGRLTDLEGRAVRFDASPRRLGVLIASRDPRHDEIARTLGAALAKSPQP